MREGGSTGLGLSIAKWIADVHNADIGVTSEVGTGTTMKFLIATEPSSN
jgi:signal transduction histidine kinase